MSLVPPAVHSRAVVVVTCRHEGSAIHAASRMILGRIENAIQNPFVDLVDEGFAVREASGSTEG
jgi:hypothetical protein